MDISCYPIRDLPDAWRAAWRTLQAADPSVWSPFLTPEYATTVDEATAPTKGGRDRAPRVEVAVWESAGEPQAFLPFERRSRSVATPVGGTLCDYQGLIARPDISINMLEMLRACELKVWHFDHVLAQQPHFKHAHSHAASSPYIDVGESPDDYRQRSRSTTRNKIQEILRKQRKLEREVAPVRFEFASQNLAMFEQLLTWKKQYYQRIRSVDHLTDRAVAITRSISQVNAEGLRGVLSVMYVGDEVGAIHLGLQSHGVLHWWIPTYNRDLHHYSPGLILLLHLAAEGAQQGYRRIDLGKGDEEYKRWLMTGATDVAEGSVDLRPAHRFVRHGWVRTREWLRDSSLRRPIQNVVRGVRAWVRQFKSSHSKA